MESLREGYYSNMLHYFFVRNHGLKQWVKVGEKYFELSNMLYNKYPIGHGTFGGILSDMFTISKKEIDYNESSMKQLLEDLYKKSLYRSYENTSTLTEEQKRDIQLAKEYRKQFWFMIEFLDQLGFIEEVDPVLTEVYEVFQDEDKLVRSFAFKSDSDEFDMYKAMMIAANSSTKAHTLGSQVGCLIHREGGDLREKLRKCGISKNTPNYRSTFVLVDEVKYLRAEGYRELVYDDDDEQLYNVERSIADPFIRDYAMNMRKFIAETMNK